MATMTIFDPHTIRRSARTSSRGTIHCLFEQDKRGGHIFERENLRKGRGDILMTKEYSSLLNSILAGMLYNPHIENPDKATVTLRWRRLLAEMIALPPLQPADSTAFHTKWTESGHKIRELVADDHLLFEMLRVWLPPYSGSDQVLFRGESIARWESGAIGTGWTSKFDKAQMFAGGLNRIGRGGVVLRAVAPASSIIAAPSPHSVYLQEFEYTVDHRGLGNVSAVEFFRNG